MGQSVHRWSVYQDESEVGLMLDTILSAIAEYDELEYMIVEESITRLESFFVKKQLEMDRRVDVTHTLLTVYKVFDEDGKKFRGSSVTEIHPGMTHNEIISSIDEALFAAGFVKNEYYPLVTNDDAYTQLEENANSKRDITSETDLISELTSLISALYAEDNHENGYLSYSEFFVAKKDVRILNSKGIDRTYAVYTTDVETAVNWMQGTEIEISGQYVMAGFNAKLLQKRVSNLFEVAAKKPLAQMTPAVKDMNILLTGECLSEFFGYYVINANAVNVYNGVSTFKVGDVLQRVADDSVSDDSSVEETGDTPANDSSGADCIIMGDKLSITLDPFLAGATGSKPYDNDGFPLDRVELIKDGVLSRYWGNVRYSSYLDMPPTGLISSFVVAGGTKSVAKMKEQPYLELISFSGFQMDAVTGNFASEIRLGFYFDGSETVAVTGGSISGNIKNVHNDMYFSVERDQFNNYDGPQTICIRNVTISGS